MKRIVFLLLTIFIIIFGGIALGPFVRMILFNTGVIQEEVYIAGTGSMYPTFPKGVGKSDIVRAKETVAWPRMRKYPGGITVFGKTLFSYNIKRGDIVEFDSEKTSQLTYEQYGQEAGFVKRVIALPGDTVELQDGYVLINGGILDEPYTAKPRSTYGGDIVPDCTKTIVDKDQVFVLGDNRKVSLDSRFELGMVKQSDIHYVLPWSEQSEYKRYWRDTKEDTLLAHTSTLDSEKFVQLLNEKRKGKNLPPLRLQSLLSQSSKLRGRTMIETNDFSNNATRSGMTVNRAMIQSGYSNILTAEVFTRGFYEAEELIDNLQAFPETNKILLNSKYQDIGLSAVIGDVGSCPVQVVVVQLGGYVPPNYKQDEVKSWKNLIENIEKVMPSWLSLKDVSGIDQSKLTRLLDILQKRLENAKVIYERMKANQYLSDSEKKIANEDKSLGEEAERIINDLNKR